MKLLTNSRSLLTTALTSSLLLAGVWAAAESGSDTLAAIDRNTNLLDNDVSMVSTMITESTTDGVEKNIVRMFRRDRDDTFLILFQEPENIRGQGYLQIDETLWFYDPESRKFTHTSIKDSFKDSDANNSDFGSSTWAIDYRVTGSEAAKLGSFSTHVLTLAATSDEVTYPSMKIWVNDSPLLVLKAEAYSLSGRLMRTSYFPSYTKAGDAYMATKMIFVDEVVSGDKTTLTFDQVSTIDLDDSVFTKAYVERVNK
jgi:outer membrane lipoprotein-sorting protein